MSVPARVRPTQCRTVLMTPALERLLMSSGAERRTNHKPNKPNKPNEPETAESRRREDLAAYVNSSIKMADILGARFGAAKPFLAKSGAGVSTWLATLTTLVGSRRETRRKGPRRGPS